MFQRPFRGKGYIPLSTYLTQFKVGQYVDIKVNGAVHKVGAPAAGRQRHAVMMPSAILPGWFIACITLAKCHCRACPTSITMARPARSGT